MRNRAVKAITGSLMSAKSRRNLPAISGRTVSYPILALLIACLVVELSPTWASDHADPIALTSPESNITDLFFFPDGDQMILVFDVRRSLRNPKPYNFDPFVYEINMDFTTPLTFDSAEDRARYGATIPQ